MSTLAGTSRSQSYFAVLLFIVGPIYAITPLAWATVLFTLWSGTISSYTPPAMAAFLWAVLEVIFSIYHYTLARRIMTTSSLPRPPNSFRLMQATFLRVLQAGLAQLPKYTEETSYASDTSLDDEQDTKERGSVPRLGSPFEAVVELDVNDPRARDFREYMRNWFHKRPWSDIHTHEMRQWLYWSSFNTHLPPDAKLSLEHKAFLEKALTMVQRRAGTTIKHGSNPKCKPLLLTLDPITIHPRPLIFYAFVWFLNSWISWTFQRFFGLKYGKYGNLEYLVRIPQHTRNLPAPRPLVFIHGLGLGLFQYYLLLNHLFHVLPTHPILIPLQPHISQNIFHSNFLKPLSPEESVASLAEVVRIMGWQDGGVNMMSHSNGSYFHAWMLKAYPDLIKRSCFVDPVSFCSWEGGSIQDVVRYHLINLTRRPLDVCYNFVYRPCSTGMQLMMRYFVGSELGVANFIQRHFDWYLNSLWFEEIPQALDPQKAAFALGGLDVIVNTERVRSYLHSHGVRKGLWFDPKGRHGHALNARGKGMRRIVAWLLDEV